MKKSNVINHHFIPKVKIGLDKTKRLQNGKNESISKLRNRKLTQSDVLTLDEDIHALFIRTILEEQKRPKIKKNFEQ